MPTVTITIAFQDSLLNEIDKTARKEFRSRSELIREAARLNIEHRRQWSDLFYAWRYDFAGEALDRG